MKIECSNVSRSFGRTKALDGVSLSFEKGHIIGLLGRNGAGKSTLIKSIGNRIYQDFGSITIEGREIRRSPEDFERIMIVGDENMLPSSTKLKNVFRMLEDSGAGSFEKAMELSRKFKLDVNKKWEKLSTGYRTIFKDIIGLASSREFVFFDEPILGLDANHRELFYEELLSAFSPDRCFVVATHLIEEIAPVIDTVIIIDKGIVVSPMYSHREITGAGIFIPVAKMISAKRAATTPGLIMRFTETARLVFSALSIPFFSRAALRAKDIP